MITVTVSDDLERVIAEIAHQLDSDTGTIAQYLISTAALRAACDIAETLEANDLDLEDEAPAIAAYIAATLTAEQAPPE